MRTSNGCVVLLFCIYCCQLISSQRQRQNSCPAMKTCETCIKESSVCAWCEDEGITFDRCDTENALGTKCSKLSKVELLSEKCSGNGQYECGSCFCPKSHYGTYCQCNTNVTQKEATGLEARCRRDNKTDICSGHGSCECGHCFCDSVDGNSKNFYTGRYCECNDFNCAYSHGRMCGGPGRGVCQCSVCNCRAEYTGYACECPTHQDSCIASNGAICNGKGVCECGKCRCSRDAYYYGPTCEECPTCIGKCDQLKPCVQCKVSNSGSLSATDCAQMCSHVYRVSNIQESGDIQKKLCTFQDDDGCQFKFYYYYHNRKLRAEALTTKECPKPGPPKRDKIPIAKPPTTIPTTTTDNVSTLKPIKELVAVLAVIVCLVKV